jgi:hypothetical protein
MAKKDKEKKAGKAKGGEPEVPDGISVARHPRSAGMVRRAKGWGGVVGLALTTYLGVHAGIPPLDAMVRGLAGGVFGYLALWAIAVTVARQLVIAEVRARYKQVTAAAAAAAAATAEHVAEPS